MGSEGTEVYRYLRGHPSDPALSGVRRSYHRTRCRQSLPVLRLVELDGDLMPCSGPSRGHCWGDTIHQDCEACCYCGRSR